LAPSFIGKTSQLTCKTRSRYREQLIEAVADTEDELLEKYLSGRP
jgi:hypothetical protein